MIQEAVLRTLFWFGVIGAVREWYHAKKAGFPITRTEKRYLVAGIVLAFPVSALADWLLMLSDKATTAAVQLSLSVAIIVWAVRQMVRRTRLRGLADQQPVSTRLP